jgi:hypothetical protein
MFAKSVFICTCLLTVNSFAGESTIFNEQFSSKDWKNNWKFHWDNHTGKQGDYFFQYFTEKKLDGKTETGVVESIKGSQAAPAQAIIKNSENADELIVEFKFAMIGHYNASRFGIKLFSTSSKLSLLAMIGAGSKKANYAALAAVIEKSPINNLTSPGVKAEGKAETTKQPIPTYRWHKGTMIYSKEGNVSLAVDDKLLLDLNIKSPQFKNVTFDRILFGGNFYKSTKSRPLFSSIKIIKVNE